MMRLRVPQVAPAGHRVDDLLNIRVERAARLIALAEALPARNAALGFGPRSTRHGVRTAIRGRQPRNDRVFVDGARSVVGTRMAGPSPIVCLRAACRTVAQRLSFSHAHSPLVSTNRAHLAPPLIPAYPQARPSPYGSRA